jgi:hypothetical protein
VQFYTLSDTFIDARAGGLIKSTYDFAVFKGILVQGKSLKEWEELLEDREEVAAVEEDGIVRTQVGVSDF